MNKVFLILNNFTSFFFSPGLSFLFYFYPRTVVLHGVGDAESWRMVVKILPTRGHLEMSGDIFDCQNQGKGC